MDDITYIKRCLKLAAKGAGYVSPNPLVGAVLVKNNRIIGEGFHKKSGDAHAEINAIQCATAHPAGATLYCNLEPCCHETKKTPPCAQRIINEGIRRVVVSSKDPNPKVNGKGLELLRKANIEVFSGILHEENKELNRFFFKYITRQIPYIAVKIAQTLDGRISLEPGKQEWISCSNSKKIVHLWRSQYDGVLIGAGTLNIDNPLLTVRELAGRNPYRIILDGQLNSNIENKVFNDDGINKTIIITSPGADARKTEILEKKGCNIIKLPADNNGKINLETVLTTLGKMKICSLLVEGGQQVFSQFLANHYVDELLLFIAPKIWGKGLSSISLKDKAIINDLQIYKTERSGEDILITLRRKDKKTN